MAAGRESLRRLVCCTLRSKGKGSGYPQGTKMASPGFGTAQKKVTNTQTHTQRCPRRWRGWGMKINEKSRLCWVGTHWGAPAKKFYSWEKSSFWLSQRGLEWDRSGTVGVLGAHYSVLKNRKEKSRDWEAGRGDRVKTSARFWQTAGLSFGRELFVSKVIYLLRIRCKVAPSLLLLFVVAWFCFDDFFFKHFHVYTQTKLVLFCKGALILNKIWW